MAKISLSTSGTGTPLSEFTYNPVEIDCPQSRLSGVAKSKETVDGESITFYPYLDTRRGSMKWRGYPNDTSDLGVAFAAQITMMRTFAGGYAWMHFKDISGSYDVYETWTKVKIISVNATLRSGGGQRYDPVELVWEDAEI